MRKFLCLVVLAVFLSGCIPYTFQRGEPPYNKGYVVLRGNRAIVEYTIGKDNSVPRLKLARERFKRRKDTVEHYYKKMGYIEDPLKMTFVDPLVTMIKLIGGIFYLPAMAVSDYKYEHNPEYRKKIIKMQNEEDAREAARIQKLKEELNSYIEKELAREPVPAQADAPKSTP
ncbi:MAG: hypothetical protein PHW54_02675 [Candidatus Omnitrophica bacterium]|nr:hypothetical protein [Candidatus Omnitrophota bacterium]